MLFVVTVKGVSLKLLAKNLLILDIRGNRPKMRNSILPTSINNNECELCRNLQKHDDYNEISWTCVEKFIVYNRNVDLFAMLNCQKNYCFT